MRASYVCMYDLYQNRFRVTNSLCYRACNVPSAFHTLLYRIASQHAFETNWSRICGLGFMAKERDVQRS